MSADAEVLEFFAAGSAVPEWLISADPMSPESSLGRMTFVLDTQLVRVGTDVWLLPLRAPRADLSGGLVRVEEAVFLSFSAPTLSVAMPLSIQVLAGQETPDADAGETTWLR